MEADSERSGSGRAAFAGARVEAGADAAGMVNRMVNYIFFHLKKTHSHSYSFSLSCSQKQGRRRIQSGAGAGAGVDEQRLWVHG